MIDVYVEDYPEAANNLEMLTGELGDNLVEIMFAGITLLCLQCAMRSGTLHPIRISSAA